MATKKKQAQAVAKTKAAKKSGPKPVATYAPKKVAKKPAAKKVGKKPAAKPKPLPKKAVVKKAPAKQKAVTKQAPAKKKGVAKKAPAQQVAAKVVASLAKSSGQSQIAKVAKAIVKKVEAAPNAAKKAIRQQIAVVESSLKQAVAVEQVAQKSLVKKAAAARKSVEQVIEQVTAVVAAAVAPEAPKPAAPPPKKAAASKKVAPVAVEAASLEVGSKAPSFSLLDQGGKVRSSANLKGKPYVLYFYPRDNTPGCTQEACDFRDEWSGFEAAAVPVFGVSPDSQKSHEGFVSKYTLPHVLLSDSDTALAQAYGAWALKKNYGREFWGIVCSTFFIGADGKVRRIWRNVKVDGHARAVLAEAQTP